MKRTLSTGLLVAFLALSFAAQASAEKLGYYFDFQNKTTAPWVGGSYIESPAPVPPKGSSSVLGLQVAKDGNGYASLTDAGHDAVWMQAKFVPSANTMAIEFDATNVTNAGRLAPIIYVGADAPKTLYDFQLLGMPLENGPQHLQYEVSLKGISGAATNQFVNVAIGFMNLDRLTTTQVAGLDNIKVTIFDR